MNEPQKQFTYSPSGSSHDVVVTKLDDGAWHWQVVGRYDQRPVKQGETTGFDAQTNALQYGIDALREIERDNP